VKNKKCNFFKELIVDALYDYNDLPEKDKRAFQEHLTACPGCAVEYEEMVAVLNVMDQRRRPEMKEDYWETYTLQLQEKIAQASRHQDPKKVFRTIFQTIERFAGAFRNFTGRGRIGWALYPAAALLLILIGIAIGRYLYLPSGLPLNENDVLLSRVSPGRTGGTGGNQLSPATAEHFENLRPLLIDYSNYPVKQDSSNPGKYVLVENETLKQLILQNYLLKKIADRENNSDLTQLFQALEMILLEISNTDANEKDTVRRVQDILKQNDILFKMKIYNKPGKISENPSTI
jgi:hypothetical protein